MVEKISVIVPVYKIKEQYLKECIESISKQTYSNLEIILVDDGSPDNLSLIHISEPTRLREGSRMPSSA